jgi:hypothetical protein
MIILWPVLFPHPGAASIRMYPADTDALHALVELFRERRERGRPARAISETVAIVADQENEDPPGVHDGHSRSPRIAAVHRFPSR